jgi:hypothetical protein
MYVKDLDARLMLMLDGTWMIEITTEDPQAQSFISALGARLSTRSDLVGRVVGANIVLEVKPKEGKA